MCWGILGKVCFLGVGLSGTPFPLLLEGTYGEVEVSRPLSGNQDEGIE